MTIKRIVVPAVGGFLAEDKEAARKLRETTVLPTILAGDQVQFDFRNVEIATQSFIHALLSEAIRRLGDKAFDQLLFVNCSEAVQNVIVAVFEYTRAAASVAEGISEAS